MLATGNKNKSFILGKIKNLIRYITMAILSILNILNTKK